jgi:hypothetical protein
LQQSPGKEVVDMLDSRIEREFFDRGDIDTDCDDGNATRRGSAVGTGTWVFVLGFAAICVVAFVVTLGGII